MGPDSLLTLIISGAGLVISWAVWASVSIFKHSQEIALLKQEIKLLQEVKVVLEDIRQALQVEIKPKKRMK